MKRIYISPPHLNGRERELLLEALDSNWITTLGPQVDAFEREVCAKVGVSHAVALASGTAALHLALLVLGIERGDEVLCSDLTFAATASHDTVVGDFCNINPGVHMAGDVTVGEGCYIGMGTNVIQNITVGPWSITGAGAAVIRDIPPHVTAVGVPARVIKVHEADEEKGE